MKPAEARRLADAHSCDELNQACHALSEEREPPFEVRGDDAGEKLTHILLAQRIRAMLDEGIELKAAYREVMSGVRDVLTNE